MRGALLVSLTTLAGCGSYWDIRKGEELPIGCAGLLNWYHDADGDQWGDPGSAPKADCGPDQENISLGHRAPTRPVTPPSESSQSSAFDAVSWFSWSGPQSAIGAEPGSPH